MITKSQVIVEENDSSESEPSKNESSSDSDESSKESSSENNAAEYSNPAWVDSISKILKSNKPKNKKTLILSKAKKLNEVKKSKTKPAVFEVETADGEIKKELIETDEEKEKLDKPHRKKKRKLANLRVKPNILEKVKERTLTKIATKGVVQLFNVVRMQQKDITKKLQEAGPLEVKKDKVLKSIDKRAFLDVLMSGETSRNVNENKKINESTAKESTWSVLKDDFMMGAKMKDWDKKLEENEVEDANMEYE